MANPPLTAQQEADYQEIIVDAQQEIGDNLTSKKQAFLQAVFERT